MTLPGGNGRGSGEYIYWSVLIRCMANRIIKVTLPSEAVTKLDEQAKAQGFTARSEFLRQHLLRQVDRLVRDQQGVDSTKDLDLEQVPTWALIEEIYKRVGVRCIDVGVDDRYTLRTAVWKTRKTIKEVKNRGPAKILIVTD